MKIRIDIASALNGLYDYGCRAVSALDGAGRSAAADMEAYAKSNRPWTDRTGITFIGIVPFLLDPNSLEKL